MRSIPARQPLNVALHRTLSTADDLDVKPRVAVDCQPFPSLPLYVKAGIRRRNLNGDQLGQTAGAF